jgi:hypothetical protein
MAILAKVTNGHRTVTVTAAEPKNGVAFTLQEFYDLLECGMIQMLNLRNGTVLVFDEEGKLKAHPIMNLLATATALKLSGIAREDYIVGHAMICTKIEAGG